MIARKTHAQPFSTSTILSLSRLHFITSCEGTFEYSLERPALCTAYVGAGGCSGTGAWPRGVVHVGYALRSTHDMLQRH